MKPSRLSALIACFISIMALSCGEAPSDATSAASETKRSSGEITVPLTQEWRYSPGDDLSWKESAFDDAAWEPFSPPGTIVLPDSSTYYWLRTVVTIPPELANEPTYLSVGKLASAFDLFIDGVYAGTRGSMPPQYKLRLQTADAFLIPDAMRASGKPLTVAMRCYYQGTVAKVFGMALCNDDARNTVYYLQNFLNGDVYVILAMLCLFLGVYFVLQFASNRGQRAYLYYSISLMAIAYYFYDMGAAWWVPTSILTRAFAKTCLTISVSSLVVFYLSFFKILDNKIVKSLLALDTVAMGALLFANASNDTQLMSMFNISLLPIFASIFLSGYVLVRAAIAGNRDAIPIIGGLVIGVGFGIHDIVCQVLGLEPFAWLQGFTFFFLNVSVFVSLALRDSRMEKELSASVKTMERQRNDLSLFAAGIQKALPALSEVSSSLEGSVESVGLAVESSAKSSENIKTTLERQNRLLEESVSAIKGLLSSIESIGVELALQAKNVGENVASVDKVSESIRIVNEGVARAHSITSGFKDLSERSEGEINALTLSMRGVSDVAAEIHAITEAVSDFAERTNMLAMNASIEAAHAGMQGRGFSVIAQEIKKLAAASADKATRIGAIASEIGKQSSQGVQYVEGMRESFLAIANEATLAAGAIEKVNEQSRRQKEANEEIDASIKRLSDSTGTIRNVTKSQTELSTTVNERIEALKSECVATESAAAEILSRNEAMIEGIGTLRSVARKTRDIIHEFESLAKKA